jgi:hypothetical protein
MNNRLYFLISALVGLACGFITIHSFLEHSWTSMILWVAAGLILLYVSPSRRSALYGGAVFGFVDIASWLLSGFEGAPDQLKGFLILAFGLSVLGAACGAAGALLFYKLFRK